MDSYLDLVSKVLAKPQLSEGIDNILHKDCLNLISKDWVARLKNNVTFQDYVTDAKRLWNPPYMTLNYEYEESKRPNFKVAVVAYCKFMKRYGDRGLLNPKLNLYIMASEPLRLIARAMTSDLSVQISDDFKFSFQDCSGVLNCHECGKRANEFKAKGHKIDLRSQPCILDTSVFTGTEVANRFYSMIEPTFTDTFVAILQIKINTRYSYYTQNNQKILRISGSILDFIGFQERKLMASKTANIGFITEINNQPPMKAKEAEPSTKTKEVESSTKTDDEFGDYLEGVLNDSKLNEPFDLEKLTNDSKLNEQGISYEPFDLENTIELENTEISHDTIDLNDVDVGNKRNSNDLDSDSKKRKVDEGESYISQWLYDDV